MPRASAGSMVLMSAPNGKFQSCAGGPAIGSQRAFHAGPQRSAAAALQLKIVAVGLITRRECSANGVPPDGKRLAVHKLHVINLGIAAE